MEGQGCASEVSCDQCRLVAPKLTTILVDFALTEVAYTVVCLLQQFPVIELPVSSKVEVICAEKQSVILVLSSTEGCMVDIRSKH